MKYRSPITGRTQSFSELSDNSFTSLAESQNTNSGHTVNDETVHFAEGANIPSTEDNTTIQQCIVKKDAESVLLFTRENYRDLPDLYGHKTVVLNDKAYVTFGTDGNTISSDIYETDLASPATAYKVYSALVTVTPPAARYNHIAEVVSILGVPTAFIGFGQDGVGPLSDFYSSTDMLTWTDITPLPGVGPSTRTGAASFVANNKLYIIGGFDGIAHLSDVWSFDGLNWVEITQSMNASCPHRSNHAAWYDAAANYFCVFGGTDGNTNLNDLWYSTDSGVTWLQAIPEVTLPALQGHTVTYNPSISRAILFGGSIASGLGVFNESAYTIGFALTPKVALVNEDIECRPREYHSAHYYAPTQRITFIGGIEYVEYNNNTIVVNDAWYTTNGSNILAIIDYGEATAAVVKYADVKNYFMKTGVFERDSNGNSLVDFGILNIGYNNYNYPEDDSTYFSNIKFNPTDNTFNDSVDYEQSFVNKYFYPQLNFNKVYRIKTGGSLLDVLTYLSMVYDITSQQWDWYQLSATLVNEGEDIVLIDTGARLLLPQGLYQNFVDNYINVDMVNANVDRNSKYFLRSNMDTVQYNSYTFAYRENRKPN